MAGIAEQFFTRRWIDAAERERRFARIVDFERVWIEGSAGKPIHSLARGEPIDVRANVVAHRRIDLDIARALKGQSQTNRIADLQIACQIEQHDMVAAGFEFGAAISRYFDRFDRPHLRDLVLHDHGVQLDRGGGISCRADESIGSVAGIDQRHVRGATTAHRHGLAAHAPAHAGVHALGRRSGGPHHR